MKEKTNRNEYLKLYARKWRNENKIKFIQTQLKYWQKKLEECINNDDTEAV